VLVRQAMEVLRVKMRTGKAHDHDNHGISGHPDGGSNGTRDDNDIMEWKGKDINDNKNNGCNQDDGKTSNDGKEV